MARATRTTAANEKVIYGVDLRPFMEEVWISPNGLLASLYRHGSYIVSFMPTPSQRVKIRRKSGKFRIMSGHVRSAGIFYPGRRVARGTAYELSNDMAVKLVIR